jgi:hypothetical protein
MSVETVFVLSLMVLFIVIVLKFLGWLGRPCAPATRFSPGLARRPDRGDRAGWGGAVAARGIAAFSGGAADQRVDVVLVGRSTAYFDSPGSSGTWARLRACCRRQRHPHSAGPDNP